MASVRGMASALQAAKESLARYPEDTDISMLYIQEDREGVLSVQITASMPLYAARPATADEVHEENQKTEPIVHHDAPGRSAEGRPR